MRKNIKILLYLIFIVLLITIYNYYPNIQKNDINYSFKDNGYFGWDKRNNTSSFPLLKKDGFNYDYLPTKLEKSDTLFFLEYPKNPDSLSFGEIYEKGRVNNLLLVKISDTTKIIDTININSNFNGNDLINIRLSKSLKKAMLYYYVGPPTSGRECGPNCYSIIQLYDVKNWEKIQEIKYDYPLNFSEFAWSNDETKLVCNDIENKRILVYNLLNNQISKIKKVKENYIQAQWHDDESIIYIENSKKLKIIYLKKNKLGFFKTRTLFKTKFQFIMREKINHYFIINENKILLQIYNENVLFNKYFTTYDYILNVNGNR
jgi:hypothetical protein